MDTKALSAAIKRLKPFVDRDYQPYPSASVSHRALMHYHLRGSADTLRVYAFDGFIAAWVDLPNDGTIPDGFVGMVNVRDLEMLLNVKGNGAIVNIKGTVVITAGVASVAVITNDDLVNNALDRIMARYLLCQNYATISAQHRAEFISTASVTDRQDRVIEVQWADDLTLQVTEQATNLYFPKIYRNQTVPATYDVAPVAGSHVRIATNYMNRAMKLLSSGDLRLYLQPNNAMARYIRLETECAGVVIMAVIPK